MWENAQNKWQPEQPLHGQCGVLNLQKSGSPSDLSTANVGCSTCRKVAARATSPRPMWGAKRAKRSARRADQMSQELLIFWDSLVFPIIIFWDSLVFPNGRSN